MTNDMFHYMFKAEFVMLVSFFIYEKIVTFMCYSYD